MTFLSWRKDYEVGVKQINTEHHALFDLISEFHNTYISGDIVKKVPPILNQLIAYAETHFQNEEALMQEIEYPRLEKHREQQSDLFTLIFKMNENFSLDPVKTSAETLEFVKDWLHDHILHDDMDIADFLLKKAKKSNVMDQDSPGAQLRDAETPDIAG